MKVVHPSVIKRRLRHGHRSQQDFLQSLERDVVYVEPVQQSINTYVHSAPEMQNTQQSNHNKPTVLTKEEKIALWESLDESQQISIIETLRKHTFIVWYIVVAIKFYQEFVYWGIDEGAYGVMKVFAVMGGLSFLVHLFCNFFFTLETFSKGGISQEAIDYVDKFET